MLSCIPKFCEFGVIRNSCKAKPLKFAGAKWCRDLRIEVTPILLLMFRVVAVFQVLPHVRTCCCWGRHS